jgi:hypothetical protein
LVGCVERELIEQMGAFIQDWTDRGILITAEGVLPSREGRGSRDPRRGGHRTDGPFTEVKEVVGGSG